MSNKNKTVSFRIRQGRFEELQQIADERGLSLSSVFREYVDEFVAHDGQVETVPEHAVRDQANASSQEFPFKVEVPKSFVREHERLELECEHLREQLKEYKEHASKLNSKLEEHETANRNMVRLEEVDFETGTGLQIE